MRDQRRGCGPGVVVIPFGWWATQHPDGKAANSLTNDTLTEWGGGVAYSDTLVQVAPLTVPRPADRADLDGQIGKPPAVGCRAWPAS